MLFKCSLYFFEQFIKIGREIDVAVLSSSFLIEGAGREKLSTAVLSLKSNSQCQIVIRRPLCRRRSRDVSGVRLVFVKPQFVEYPTEYFRRAWVVVVTLGCCSPGLQLNTIGPLVLQTV